jgi:hypothetical protein
MPWSPCHDPLPAHPRLQRYAHRVAEVWRGQDEVGVLLVLPDAYWERTSGALWWRRWSAGRHAALLYLWLPCWGRPFTDAFVAPDDLAAELDGWDAGRFQFDGATYALTWLDEDESRRLAAERFGVEIRVGEER